MKHSSEEANGNVLANGAAKFCVKEGVKKSVDDQMTETKTLQAQTLTDIRELQDVPRWKI